MATVTLTNTPTVLDSAETVTNWNGDSFTLEPDIKVQGSNSVACSLTSSGNNEVFVDGFTAVDLSAEHIRLWFNISFVGNLATTNQIQVFISDGSNTAYWTISNPSEYAGGWSQAVIYTGNTPTSGTKPTGNSTQVGLRFVTSSKPRNVPANAWFDMWTFGDGYTVTGGTSGDELSWFHIGAVDKVNGYGICENINGVLFLAGDIKIGDGATTTYFKDGGQVCSFKDLPVLSTLYNITFQGSGCDVSLSGGLYLTSNPLQRFSFDVLDSTTTFSATGKGFVRASSAKFASTHTVNGCGFTVCGEIDTNGALFTNITIDTPIEDVTGALAINSTTELSNMSNIVFKNFSGKYATYISDSVTGIISMNNFTTDDTGTDVYWGGTGGTLTINKSNGTNFTTSASAGGTVSLVTSVSIDVKVVDESGADLSGINVYVDEDLGIVGNIINTTTDVNGEVSTSYSGVATSATIRIRKYGYYPETRTIDLATDSSTNVILRSHPQQQ